MWRNLSVTFDGQATRVYVGDQQIGCLESFKFDSDPAGLPRRIAHLPDLVLSEQTEKAVMKYAGLLAEAGVMVFRGDRQIAGPIEGS